ncbi:MAG: threonine--tRNA ligase [Sorangiineae bacterium]|nr:threonine--tRNA ligase [Polyangiaceae bacterium]MEB2321159.1 threonine--tRNA ligase [Sorangiineae bacterium]
MMASGRRSPRELLVERGLWSDDVVAVRVGSWVGDLHTPVDPAAELTPIRWQEPAALPVLRHSAAHVMADAVQRLFPGTQVTIGPAIDAGFYYDFDRPEGPFTDKDLARIEKEMRRIIKAGYPFYRQELSRNDAAALFERMGEKYKLEILASIPEGEAISIYRHGNLDHPETTWVDLCEGPHVPSTKFLGVVKLTSVAGAYWRGDEKNPMLQRIYGTAFPTEEALERHLKMLEEARARDHRKLGKELELFMFHEYAPAMPFFLPRGAAIYGRLVGYVRDLYVEYGYEEVITPQLFDKRLFATSGHLANYWENMYLPVTADMLDAAGWSGAEPTGEAAKGGFDPSQLEPLAQKPMNCPSHCLIFGQRRRSYRELPWRIADFGRLHRYERGGVVHGLARVRTFCQDDAHIFCTPEQMVEEIRSFNQLLFEVYAAFGFNDVSVKLALRPEKRIGSDAQWDDSEHALERVLVDSGLPFEKLPGEGAFYGPKLEFHVVDALGRSWQLGTIQVDYNMPERFGLEYVGADGAGHRPVMLHRAILGSIERFFGMYIEHVAGKFPVWLAPEQATLVTVSEKQADYAEKVRAALTGSGLRIGLDAGPDKLGAKIRNARNSRVPYIVVIGEQEAAEGTVSPRGREEGDLGSMTIEQFSERLVAESKAPRRADKK